MSPCIILYCYTCGWRLRRGIVGSPPSSCQRTCKYLKICSIRKSDHGMTGWSRHSFLLVNNFLLCFVFLLLLLSSAIKYSGSIYLNLEHFTVNSYIMTINNIRFLCQYYWRNYCSHDTAKHVTAIYLAQGCWICFFFLFMHPFEGFLDVPAKETLRTAFLSHHQYPGLKYP